MPCIVPRRREPYEYALIDARFPLPVAISDSFHKIAQWHALVEMVGLHNIRVRPQGKRLPPIGRIGRAGDNHHADV